MNGTELFVFNNLTGKEIVLDNTAWTAGCEKVIGNYDDVAVEGGHLVLRPYESIVY